VHATGHVDQADHHSKSGRMMLWLDFSGSQFCFVCLLMGDRRVPFPASLDLAKAGVFLFVSMGW